MDLGTEQGRQEMAEWMKAQGMGQREIDAQVRQMEIMGELAREHPNLPAITLHILANDKRQAEWATKAVQEGADPIKESVMVGSFARFEWILDNCPWEWVKKNICDEWRGSDPDDTNPKFIEAWTRAWGENGHKYLKDGKGLPRNKTLEVYRGQMAEDPVGLSWSLSVDIADKFARGAGIRVGNMEGTLFVAQVWRDNVMAYITGRGEEEVIIHPSNIRNMRPVHAYKRKG